MLTIDSFRGAFDFLSNFYASEVEFEGQIYPSSEHAFQAAKTLNFNARKVFSLPGMTPGMAKHLGRALDIRKDWDHVKLSIMTQVLASKFRSDDMKALLISTGDAELIEGNTWGDTYWGVCDGKGSNFLGLLLMELRKELTTPKA
mgnify:CR=1 FL=1